MSDAVKPDPSDAALVLEYEFDAPPAKVWRAVTIPALRERWLPDSDVVGAPSLNHRSWAKRCATGFAIPNRRFAKAMSSSGSNRTKLVAPAFASSSKPATIA
ncbi:hypothetical protein ACVWW4_005253 [Bradyrhizobium sp. LB7.1]